MPSLVTAPLAELGLETFFAFDDDANDDEGSSSSSTDVDGERAARLGALVADESGGLPFVVTQHASAATPTAKRTLARLRRDIQAAASSAAAARAARRARRAGGLAAATSADGVVDVAAFQDAHLKGLAPEDAKALAREAAATLLQGASRESGVATVRARGALVAVLRALRTLAARDRAAATEAAAAATSTANGLSRDPSAARAMLRLGLNRRSGAWAEATFDDLVEGLLCSDGEKILARLTPGVGEAGAAAALHLAAEALLLTSRATLASRAAAAAEDAIAAVDGAAETVAAAASVEAGVEACEFGVSLAAKALADLLRTKRHYFDRVSGTNAKDPSGSEDEHLGEAFLREKRLENDSSHYSCHYDPRMLVFEYAQGVVLRERQVALVRDFARAAASARGAECAQMLMGEGKTTMICPLLGFMLANQETLVVQVVPQSLLEFSRGCLRRAFAGVVRRSVVTLAFDRFTPLTPAPLYALRKARRSQALVVTTPTALKSLVLKFLETAHLLDQSYVARVEGAAVESHMGNLGRLFEGATEFRSRSERVADAGGLSAGEILELRKEGAVAAEIVKLFQTSGVLVLDEVDLILHPLRSELHWPLGRRVPLDFSKARAGDGLRWKLPFFILDAVFGASSRRVSAEEARGSNEAAEILRRISACFKEATKSKGSSRSRT